MELQELVGEHLFDAIDFSNEQVATWGEQFEDCQVVRFRLDGVCYTAIENPDDGYRSSMKDLFVETDAAMMNVFPPLQVIGRYRTEGEYGEEDDVLELIDAVTGKVVLEVGTHNIADYYPGFVAVFHPEAMAHNQVKP